MGEVVYEDVDEPIFSYLRGKRVENTLSYDVLLTHLHLLFGSFTLEERERGASERSRDSQRPREERRVKSHCIASRCVMDVCAMTLVAVVLCIYISNTTSSERKVSGPFLTLLFKAGSAGAERERSWCEKQLLLLLLLPLLWHTSRATCV